MKSILYSRRNGAKSSLVVRAGLAGGISEIAWIALFGAVFTGAAGGTIARQVAETVFPGAGDLAIAPVAGVTIHLTLSIALAFAYWKLVWRPFARRLGTGLAIASGMAALAAVWAVNFFVILPALNPAFVALLPFWATLASKLLFGAAMTAVLLASEARDSGRTGPPVHARSLSG